MSHRRVVWLLLLVASLSAEAARAESPHWIGGARRLTRSVALDGAASRAAVRMAADFATARLLVNGSPVLIVEPYCQAQDLDITRWIRRGANELAIELDPVPGPAAVALSFAADFQDGQRLEIVSDGSWQAGGNGDVLADFGAVRPELWGLGRRPATISPFENYEQWRQTLDKNAAPQTKFEAPPGFRVVTVRNAAADEGSWIALALDGAGRLTISREDQGLLRMTLAGDGRSVARVERIDVDLKECRGLVYADGSLFANANNSRALCRLRIDDDGRAHDLVRLREFPGELGHGRNDLALGPGGVLYSMHGDSVQPPGPPLIDRTSPLRESRQGPPRKEAYLLRTDQAGRRWELICTGLRNPYGVAVQPGGERFTYDADNEFDMGTPWYRPTRIVQLLSGADYGYRAAGKEWPPNFPDHPDNGLPLIDVGRGSPTAAMFGTDLKFPESYRRAMFALDWSYGRVLAVHLAPRGGGYRAALEVFLQGRPLNVTDVAAGSDGALWLSTGGRKTQSALYRIDYVGPGEPAAPASPHEQAAAEFSDRQRAQLRRLEQFHGAAQPAALDVAWPFLSDADPTLRHAARIAIEQLPPEAWRSRALATGENAAAQRAAWMALVRTGDKHTADETLARALAVAPEGLDLAARFELLFLVRECRRLIPDAAAAQRHAVVRQLLAWAEGAGAASGGRRVSRYGDQAEYRRRTALVLGEFAAPETVAFIQPLLASAVQEDRLMGLLAARNMTEGWTPEARRAYLTALRESGRFVGGQGMPEFIERLRKESLATLTAAERETFADLLAPAAGESEPLPPPRAKVREWSLADLAELHAADAGGGNAERGAAVFRDALCSRCHRAGLAGPAVGPDLTFVARRFSRRDMLESILKPSLAVAEQYRSVLVVTEDGRTLVGRPLAEGDFRSEKLRLSVDPLRPAEVVELDKKEIAEFALTETSPMPQGLLDGFTLAEIRDLLAFLERGAGE